MRRRGRLGLSRGRSLLRAARLAAIPLTNLASNLAANLAANPLANLLAHLRRNGREPFAHALLRIEPQRLLVGVGVALLRGRRDGLRGLLRARCAAGPQHGAFPCVPRAAQP